MKLSRRFLSLALAVAVGAGINLQARQAAAVVVIAENLLVDLDASHASAGTASWSNTGSLGGAFAENGDAVLSLFGPTDAPGVEFFGTQAYQGPAAPAGITGNGTRSIEVWAYNPALNPEETLVSFGRRGGPEGSNLAFNYGSNATFGAVGHWGGPDMGWNGDPTPGSWHHLVYTYDGSATRVYDNGILKNTRVFNAITHADFPINIAAQNSGASPAPGSLDPGNRLSGAIGKVRIHDGVLGLSDIINNMTVEAPLYGVTPPPPPPPPPVPELIPAGPRHRYSFSGNADDSVSGAHGTLVNPQGLATYHDGVVDLTPANNGANSNQAVFSQGAFVDLPNGIISDLGTKATFEIWMNVQTNQTWAEAWSFGKSDSGEGSAGGAPNSDYITLIPQSGPGVLRLTHRSNDGGFGENFVDGSGPLTAGVEHHLVAVWDEENNTQALYLDGVQLPNSPGGMRNNISLATLQDLNNWLGRSQWGDPLLDATINEFRIYDYALTTNQILGNYQAGADLVNAVPEPSSFVLAGFAAAVLGCGAWRRRCASNVAA